MGSLFSKSNKAPKSRVTEHDKAVLQLKQQRDNLKQYQRRIEQSLEKDRLLAKKCLQNGRKDRAKLLLRKKKYQESLLVNTDKQLENIEKMTNDLEFAQVELQVIEGLKQGNVALKKVHAILDIQDIESIMDETREGIEKQQEIDAMLSEVLTTQDEEDVLAELDALVAEEDQQNVPNLPDVPAEELPSSRNMVETPDVEGEVEVEEETTPTKKTKAAVPAKVMLEA